MRSIFKRKIQLSVFPAVVLLGMLTGIMFCAFFLGYASGSKVGFEEAMRASLKHVSRVPIPGMEQSEITDRERAEIYSELEKPVRIAKNSEASPVQKKEDTSLLLNGLLKKKNLEKEQQEVVKPEGELDAADSSKTLGSILEEKQQIAKKEPEVIAEIPEKKKVAKKEVSQERPEEQVKQAAIEVADKPDSKVDTATSKRKEKPAVQVAAKKVERELPADEVAAGPGGGFQKPKSFISKEMPSGWYAQVAAPQSVADANDLAQKLHNSGFPVVIEKAVVNSGTYFRVLVGAEKNRTQALRLVDQLKREPFITGDPFVRKMG